MGRGDNPETNINSPRRGSGSPAAVKQASNNPLEATRAKHDYTDLEGYASYGVLEEMQYQFDGLDNHSVEEGRIAGETLGKIQNICRESKNSRENSYDALRSANINQQDLETTERVLLSLAANDYSEDDKIISETFDPDLSFMQQSDADHAGAIADYVYAIRTGKAREKASAAGMTDASRDNFANQADSAHDAARPGVRIIK